ncbi:type II secretion system protein [bacterium]
MRKNNKGFTLIELMIIVAIIGILAIVGTAQFGNVIRKSKESTTRRSLHSIRSAINIYYANNYGEFPASITAAPFFGDYIDNLKITKLNDHEDSIAVKTAGGIDDAGGWHYNSSTGELHVNCTHTDFNGTVISSW